MSPTKFQPGNGEALEGSDLRLGSNEGYVDIVVIICEAKVHNSCICILGGVAETMKLSLSGMKVLRKVAARNLLLGEQGQF